MSSFLIHFCPVGQTEKTYTCDIITLWHDACSKLIYQPRHFEGQIDAPVKSNHKNKAGQRNIFFYTLYFVF